MKKFTVKVTDTNRALINNFRRTINNSYTEPLRSSFGYVEYLPIDRGEPELSGCFIDKGILISTEEFVRFYNEKMGINQSIIYELW